MFQMKLNQKTIASCISLALLGAGGNALANPDKFTQAGVPDYSGLAFYLEDYSIDPTDAVKVHVSLPENATGSDVLPVTNQCVQGASIAENAGKLLGNPGVNYQIGIFRVTGNESSSGIETIVTNIIDDHITGSYQGALPADAYKVDLEWDDGVVTITPIDNGETWKSGVYKVRVLLGTSEDDCNARVAFTTFTVNPPAGSVAADKKILVVDNLYFKASQTDFGGGELRLFEDSSNANLKDEVSINRPTIQNQELTRVVSWIDKHYPGQYDVMSMGALEDRSISADYELVVLTGKNSVWSQAGRDAYQAYLASGGNAVILGGELLFWKAERIDDNLKVNVTTNVNDRTWFGTGSPEDSLTGLSFRHGGFVNIPGAGNTTGSFTAAGFEGKPHWILSGTSTAANAQFGTTIAPSVSKNLAGPLTAGAGNPSTDGTPQGLEIIGSVSTSSWELEADGTPKTGTGTPAIFKTAQGGYVFNAATTSWGEGLWDFNNSKEPVDSIAAKMTTNVIDVFLSTGGVEADADEDGIPDAIDNENNTPTVDDADGDTILDVADNCPANANQNQLDTDSDGAGNVCDDDDDGDGVNDADDAFPLDATRSAEEPTTPTPTTPTSNNGGGGGSMGGLLLTGLFSLAAIRRKFLVK